MLKEKNHLMEVLQIIGLKYKTLYLRNGFLIKFHTISRRLVITRIINGELRRENLVIHQRRKQLVESVIKTTMVVGLRGQIIALVVERLVRR